MAKAKSSTAGYLYVAGWLVVAGVVGALAAELANSAAKTPTK